MTPSTQILARIKLRETERQRDRLNAQYDIIERQAAQATTPLDKLRVLYEGLRHLTFAQKPLHPEIANLDVLYLADELGSAPPDLVAERTALLERELAQGRLRAEFTYAFGRILSDWAGPAAESSLPSVEGADNPVALLWQEPAAIDDAYFTEAFAALEPALRTAREAIARYGESDVFVPVRKEEVSAALDDLARNPYALSSFRSQASAVRTNDRQVHEYAGVMTILLNNLDEWDWPAEGMNLRAVWARIKYRPYLDEDLITALFLAVVGRRWGAKLKPLLTWQSLRVGERPLFPEEPLTSPTSLIGPLRLQAQATRFMATVPTGDEPEGEGGYTGDTMREVLEAVEREIRLARALHPDRPLFVVQADLADFYPTVPHEVLFNVLRRLNVPDRWLRFFGKFLSVTVHTPDGPRRLRRGLPLDHLLAPIFTECLLFVLDTRLALVHKVQPIRVVDDIWLLADSHGRARAAWDEVRAFCKAAGLAVNERKCGTACLGQQQAADGFPEGRPRWGLLILRDDGQWHVSEETFQRLEATIRTHVAAAPSVLELVSCYNGYVHHLVGKLALSLHLEGDHLRRMAARMTHTHESLFGEGHGLVEEVRRRLQDSFADARLKARGVPEALIYWPITAGGLALLHPQLQVATYLRGRPSRVPKPPTTVDVVNKLLSAKGLKWLSADEAASFPAGPVVQAPWRKELARFFEERPGAHETPTQPEINQQAAELWRDYYIGSVPRIVPGSPATMPAMERLVSDFISRGSEVSGRTQGGLTPYWRWVVYTYGPALLEALGTFRFLMTELVPLQLILENRRSARWEVEGEPESSPPQAHNSGDEIPF